MLFHLENNMPFYTLRSRVIDVSLLVLLEIIGNYRSQESVTALVARLKIQRLI